MIRNSYSSRMARSLPKFDTFKRKYDELADTLQSGLINASEVALQVIKMLTRLSSKIRLSVTYAIDPNPKSHAAHPLENLLRAGSQVILVSNSDSPAQGLVVELSSARQPAGIFITNNQGFDFAAWSYTIQLCGKRSGWTRYSLFDANKDFDACEGGLSQDPQGPEGTLISQGFSYIKTWVLRQQSGNARLQALRIPTRAQGRL